MKSLTTLDLRFFATPFVSITLSFACGILAGFEVQSSTPFFVSLFIVCSLVSGLIYWRKLVVNLLLACVIHLSFFSLGAVLIQERLGVFNTHSLELDYHLFDPIQLEITELGATNSEWIKVVGTVSSIFHENQEIAVHEAVVLYIKNEKVNFLKGDIILVSSQLSRIKNNGNPGEFDAENYWAKKGISYTSFVGEDDFKLLEHQPPFWIFSAMEACRDYLSKALSANLKGKELAIAQALILGDKSLLDQEVKNSFTNTGAMHVLAVSGLHIGIIMQILMVVLGSFPKLISRKSALTTVLIVMWIYAFITGMSPSVLRAVVMFTVYVFSQLWGKQYNAINALFLTGFSLCLLDPFVIYDIGFQLSFLAMLGIFLFYKPIGELVYIKNKWLRKIWEGTAIGFAAQLMTTPLSLYYFHQFPNYFILTNIGLMASSGLILGAGIALFAASWWSTLSKLIGIVLTWFIFLSLAFIEWVEGLPGGVAYGFTLSIFMVLAFTTVVLLLFLGKKSLLNRSILFGLGFALLTLLVFERYKNLNTNELCVFNSRQFTFVVKKENAIFCFFRAKENDFTKVQRLAEAYQKLYPGKISYFDLEKKNWQLTSDDLIIKTEKVGPNWTLQLNDKKYTFLFVNDRPTSSSAQIIALPWLESASGYELSKGAFRQEI